MKIVRLKKLLVLLIFSVLSPLTATEVKEKARDDENSFVRKALLNAVNEKTIIRSNNWPFSCLEDDSPHRRFFRLQSSEEEEIRKKLSNALDELPSEERNKILIFGVQYLDPYLPRKIGKAHGSAAVTLDIDLLKRFPKDLNDFMIFLAAGNILAHYKGIFLDTELDTEEEEVVVMTDIYALNVFLKQGKPINNLALNRNCSASCLSGEELLYHSKKLQEIQRDGKILDPLSYAKKIIDDRKTDNYTDQLDPIKKKLEGKRRRALIKKRLFIGAAAVNLGMIAGGMMAMLYCCS